MRVCRRRSVGLPYLLCKRRHAFKFRLSSGRDQIGRLSVLLTFLAIPPEKPACPLCLLWRLILYFDRIGVDSNAARVQIAAGRNHVVGGLNLALVGGAREVQLLRYPLATSGARPGKMGFFRWSGLEAVG